MCFTLSSKIQQTQMYRQGINRITDILPWKAISSFSFPCDFDYDEQG